MIITTWLQSSTALTLAKTLLHSLWQSGIAAFLLAACLRLTTRSRVRYAAACGVLATIVVASIGTFLFLLPVTAPSHSVHQAVYPGLASSIPYSANATPVSTRSFVQIVLPWITPVWFVGFLLFTARQVASWAGTRRMRQRGVCVAPGAWQQRLDDLQNRMKVSKPVL